jgi:23S rRNA G2445 N2-methylase RlmL
VLDAIASSRHLPIWPSYSVTASYLGKRNYSRYDIESAVQDAIAARYDWEFIPNRPEEDDFHDIDLRVLVEEDWALVGIRIGTVPLHRRPYKIASLPGSLKAPIAYCLCLLADLKPTDNLLDPTCGAGTILIEASTLVTRGTLTGIDIDASAITAARQNGEAAGLPITTDDPTPNAEPTTNTPRLILHHGDLQHVQMQPAGFQAVIANPPWGNQVTPQTDLLSLYAALFNLIDHVLTVDGRAVIITDQVTTLQTALHHYPQLTLISTTPISLFGSHPTIHVIQKS